MDTRERLSRNLACHLVTPGRRRRMAFGLAALAPHYFASRLRAPFFIIGCARSGTTLLVDSIGRHRDLATYPGEANGLWHPRTFPWRCSRRRRDVPPLWVDPECFSRTSVDLRTPRDARRMRSVFGAYQWMLGRPCFLAKSAMITFMVPRILEECPSARFIHIVRDGRSVALSYAKMEYHKILRHRAVYAAAGYDLPIQEILGLCAKAWRAHIDEVERQTAALALKARGLLHEVRYEELCQAPHETVDGIARFMGIDPGGFHTAGFTHVRNMNLKRSAELDPRTLAALTELLQPALRAKGYA